MNGMTYSSTMVTVSNTDHSKGLTNHGYNFYNTKNYWSNKGMFNL